MLTYKTFFGVGLGWRDNSVVRPLVPLGEDQSSVLSTFKSAHRCLLSPLSVGSEALSGLHRYMIDRDTGKQNTHTHKIKTKHTNKQQQQKSKNLSFTANTCVSKVWLLKLHFFLSHKILQIYIWIYFIIYISIFSALYIHVYNIYIHLTYIITVSQINIEDE